MVIRNNGKLKKLVKAKKISADFNMSSIAVSRELIIQNFLQDLLRIMNSGGYCRRSSAW